MSVIVPSYQRRASLLRLLGSLDDAIGSNANVEVVVVLDGSTDGSREALEHARFAFSLRWQWQPNRGRSAARPVNPEVIERTRQTAKILESLGHTIVEVDEKEICEFEELYKAFEWFYLYVYDWADQVEQSGYPINEKTLEPAFIAAVEYRKKHPMPPGIVDEAFAPQTLC